MYMCLVQSEFPGASDRLGAGKIPSLRLRSNSGPRSDLMLLLMSARGRPEASLEAAVGGGGGGRTLLACELSDDQEVDNGVDQLHGNGGHSVKPLLRLSGRQDGEQSTSRRACSIWRRSESRKAMAEKQEVLR